LRVCNERVNPAPAPSDGCASGQRLFDAAENIRRLFLEMQQLGISCSAATGAGGNSDTAERRLRCGTTIQPAVRLVHNGVFRGRLAS
jgi:hypothetical protein